MKGKVITGIVLTALLLGMLTLALNIQQVKAESLPLISVNPQAYTAPLGVNFTIRIDVTNVTDLYGYDIWLEYNSSILNHTAVTVDGPGQVAPTNPAQRVTVDKSVPGTIKHSCAFIYAMGAPSFNGSGTLAWITFNAIGLGKSALQFDTYWTQLFNSTAEVIPSMLDGSVTVITVVQTSVQVAGENYPIIIKGNVSITDVTVTTSILYFTTSGPTGVAGVNTTIPVGLNRTSIEVFVDDVKLTQPPFPIITTNGTHYFIYFEITLSTHNIILQFGPTPVGGISIPVNKLALLAPYIELTILLAVAFMTVGYVKKRKRNTEIIS